MMGVHRLLRRGGAWLGMDPRWLEASSGSAALLWGLSLLQRGGADLPAGYEPIARFIPAAVVAGLFGCGGALQLVAVLLDHPVARIPLASFMASAWFLVAYSVAIGAPASPTIAVFLSLGAWNAAAMIVLIYITMHPR